MTRHSRACGPPREHIYGIKYACRSSLPTALDPHIYRAVSPVAAAPRRSRQMSVDAGCAAEAAQLFAAHAQDGLLGTLVVQNTILLVLLFALSALLAWAFRKCRSIHRNSRVILFNFPAGAMLYAVSEFTKMVYYQVNRHLNA